MSSQIKSIKGKACPIVGENIDTDQIIPARYLTAVSFSGMEKGLFYDLRFDKNNKSLDFITDNEKHKNHNIYFVNSNFGCGSSREHAPQAIKRSGIEAIIGVSYSEIFFGNCSSIGLACFNVSAILIKELQEYVTKKPDTVFDINIESLSLSYDGISHNLELSKPIQESFLTGTYDPIDILLTNKENILNFEKSLTKYD